VVFKVIISAKALADLEELTDWSWENYSESSQKFSTALLNHIDMLSSFPFLGAPMRRFRGLRRLLHSPLYIYYVVEPEKGCVEILRIWHTSRRRLNPFN
jgi:plasmid stabilization system protein ParE